MTSHSPFPHVVLICDDACPNVALARSNLLAAFALVGLAPEWSEHRIGDPEAPAYTRGYGSPTILVDGEDVAGVQPGSNACCRVYAAPTQLERAPSIELIAAALTSASG